MRKLSLPKVRILQRQRNLKNHKTCVRQNDAGLVLYYIKENQQPVSVADFSLSYHLSSDETVSFLRPRRRRAANTRRPFGVDMRSRKPCLLRRLRCDGWNVLFISRDFYISIFWECKGSKIDFIYKIFFIFLYKSPALFQRTGHLSMKISAIGAQNLFSSCALPWL